MRVTNTMMTNTTMLNLNNNLRRLDFYNKQFSTTKKFTLPSENPVGVSKSLVLNTTVNELKQNQKSAQGVLSWLEITESAVQDVNSVIQRARELAVSADGVETPKDKEKIQIEIDSLKDQLIKLGNSTYSGKYIFSGYKTNQPLLDKDGKYAIDVKKDEKMDYQIGKSDLIDVNTLGHQLFGVGIADPSAGTIPAIPDNVNKNESAQLIAVFDYLSTALAGNNQDQIEEALGMIDKHHENVLGVLGEIGAKSNRMEMTIKRIDKDIMNFTSLLSKNEDADMAQVSIDLKTAETVYRASLAAGSKVIQPSLVDFMR
ncbi:flagellar hook-associated protein FlgL [Anaerophilus nitritogenes]|uniref:flagellar hook-associated protein FlgL n=1 Tax=Anaerophilus nitritogenes TaxID=2498136 RepID=UPI00101C2968|nr:flagellar hook-associated protein FlgL [Anaerophilus nitritogenes]